jgi:hypothetical protein
VVWVDGGYGQNSNRGLIALRHCTSCSTSNHRELDILIPCLLATCAFVVWRVISPPWGKDAFHGKPTDADAIDAVEDKNLCCGVFVGAYLCHCLLGRSPLTVLDRHRLVRHGYQGGGR